MHEGRRRAFEAGRQRWAGVLIRYVDFVKHLDRLGELGEPPPHVDGVYLCCACALGRPEARQLLENTHTEDLRGYVAQLSVRGDPSEVWARLRHELFYARPSLVAGYSGRLPLAAWLRVTALRAVLLGEREVSFGSGHPELEAARNIADLCHWLLLPRDFAGEPTSLESVRSALAEALDTLPLREQTLLRLHVGCGVSTATLSKAYQLPEAALKRAILSCRERLLTTLGKDAGPGAPLVESLSIGASSGARSNAAVPSDAVRNRSMGNPPAVMLALKDEGQHHSSAGGEAGAANPASSSR